MGRTRAAGTGRGKAGTMTAVVKTAAAAGPDATAIRTVPIPTPGQAEVLIRVIATAVCGSDKHIYQWDPSMAGMVRVPRIYGHEFCGEIVAFGRAVLGPLAEDEAPEVTRAGPPVETCLEAGGHHRDG